MRNSNFVCQYRVAALLLFAGFVFAPDCAAQLNCASPVGEIQKRYCQAVEEAKRVDPGKVSKNLIAIEKSNTSLKWNGLGSRVLVVTLVTQSLLSKVYKAEKDEDMTLVEEVWVSVAPELQDSCRKYGLKGGDLTLRLEQLHGLPPRGSKTHLVEFWVLPDDLFRPCPDPEINDHECVMDFPRSRFLSVQSDYVYWFIERKSLSYLDKDPYPWTRLGYTYDWGKSKDYLGLSEFVVRPGAVIVINSKSTTGEYCSS